MGEICQARSYFDKALAVRKKILPVDHPDLVSTYNNISVLYSDMELCSIEPIDRWLW